MQPSPDRRWGAAAAGVLFAASALVGCAATDAADPAATVTVTNCGAEVSFAAVPERVVLLKSASVPFLAELGVLDHVVARAGVYPREYYDDATWAALEAIPVLTDQIDTSGHLQISREEVLAQRPDLVLGEVDNISRATLAASNVPLLEEPALCGVDAHEPTFDDIDAQMTLYGQVFDRADAAAAANARLDERVSAARERVAAGESRTAAVLYPTIGGGVTYAYGRGSMAHPQLEAAGFTNVYADVADRVFEVTREDLIGRDPDVLVLLYSSGDADAVKQAVTSMRGADAIAAVRDDAIVTQPLNFSEPPTPLAVTGLERIVDQVGERP
ncbi:MAG: ABC transporter substrate-binding protein [Propionibacteriaceae bacterium]|nr:ABC transporter substrate-binding protein [Propionibacteriaceae bacterium]